jgi:hypothetical protein
LFFSSLIPAKVWREWNALFVGDRPFFDDEKRLTENEQDEINRQEQKLHAQTVLQEESFKILDEGDFNEYRNMIGEWEPPPNSQSANAITHVPPLDNPIFGYIVNRLHNLVHPPAVCLVFLINNYLFTKQKLSFRIKFHYHYFQHLD